MVLLVQDLMKHCNTGTIIRLFYNAFFFLTNSTLLVQSYNAQMTLERDWYSVILRFDALRAFALPQ